MNGRNMKRQQGRHEILPRRIDSFMLRDSITFHMKMKAVEPVVKEKRMMKVAEANERAGCMKPVERVTRQHLNRVRHVIDPVDRTIPACQQNVV